MEFKSYFDAKLRKSGNSLIITIPHETIEKLGLEPNKIIKVGIEENE
jgi:antitoxin component of MazEF toxin-antitoxin module